MTRNRILLIGVVLLTGLLGAGFVFLKSQPASRTLPSEFVRPIETSAGTLTMVRFGPEGKSLLAGGATGEVVSVTLEPDRVQQLAPPTDDSLTCLAESPDGLILAGAASGRLRAWERPELTPTPVSSPKLAVSAVAFGIERTERRMVLGLSDGRIVITSPEGEKIQQTKHRGVKSLLMTPDGPTLISSGSEGLILWSDAETGSLIGEFEGHRTEVASLVLSPDGTQVASGDWNGEIKVLDVRTREEVASVQQPDAVSGLVWNGERLISASWDGWIRSWRVASGKLAEDHSFDSGAPIHSLAVSPDGSLAATTHGSANIDLWQLSSGH
jgi:WD40 repeat protein